MESMEGTLGEDLEGRLEGKGVHLCPGSCCIAEILLKAAFQEREESMKGGEGEDSVGCMVEGIDRWAEEAWTGNKEGKRTQAPPCARRGRGDEGGYFFEGL